MCIRATSRSLGTFSVVIIEKEGKLPTFVVGLYLSPTRHVNKDMCSNTIRIKS
jgi:hypothetical protein